MEIILKYFSDFDEKQLRQFAALEELYKDWNGKINVISRKDIESLYLKHVLHSLAIAATIEFQPGTSVIDIGTGGGFPGVPLAIFFPEVQFHLVDSIAKKLKVINEVSNAIGLTNITTQHTRAEEIKNRQFDFAVSRAVAPIKDLWKWAYPLIKRGNKQELPNGLICLKGGDLVQEIAESSVKPRMIPIDEIFEEDYFKEKYLLHITK
ncbi:16S rRNA (guanine(527)-N(7))-methyltransferase RsmG [Segetibacter aerophilus]|uniref:Ribosomal RNA small subunit methyltransferase G n=1 Tax=Segetibacter aerophilus TaxID=670293 RepID=A0A512BDR8_9BACT|nr:16S rRNA (guanine(527)-N(7))-methyltransferase RsmG [Segetibacter aerophilus]GEO10100.1 ribosomal RNA small subunit methyltransferase G [Segetibacter aerophilus]